MRANHVRRRLAAGEPSIGTWLSLPSPEAAEYVSRVGFDWLVVDTEHNPVDIRTLAQMFAAMAASSTAPMVRIPWNSGEDFKRARDAGDSRQGSRRSAPGSPSPRPRPRSTSAASGSTG